MEDSSSSSVPESFLRLSVSFAMSSSVKTVAPALILSTPNVRPTKFKRLVAAMKSSSRGFFMGMLMYSCWPDVSSSSFRLRSTAWILFAVEAMMILERRAAVRRGCLQCF